MFGRYGCRKASDVQKAGYSLIAYVLSATRGPLGKDPMDATGGLLSVVGGMMVIIAIRLVCEGVEG
jgi:hypothetical protein